ncbi:putative alpha/beta-fold hydrolase [Neisseria perflava]|uniref:YheT family hydrolase n=1 Tax=Neisseria perflava TaxID=33053 RepID=UPI00209EEBF7|nr:alpha/beta fold hydrolase [Neisseria perflava]MCP1772968.1 putative alpha/beta-fold hydrolase [Neisseria perflava]
MNPPAPPFWLHNGYADTLFAKSLQAKPPAYRRELLPNRTGHTQIAYDFLDGADPAAPLVVLFHGLEGSSRSHYAIELMKAVHQKGWHGVVAHSPGCGGVPNTLTIPDHSGETREMAFALETLAARYPKIYAVGVSLGGNKLAKYLGEQGRLKKTAVPYAAASVSAPVDLTECSYRFDHGMTRLLYTRYFLSSVIPKARHFSGFHETVPLSSCKTIGEFDDVFTVPLHGFADRYDYYRQASSKPYLRDVATPLLLLNARNDPFLPGEALPTAEEVSPGVTLMQTPYGGHVGFTDQSGGHLNIRWLPQTLLDYFSRFE